MKPYPSIRNKAFKVAATGASLAIVQPVLVQETSGRTFAEIEPRAVASPSAKLVSAPAQATRQVTEVVIENEAVWDEDSTQRFGELSRKFALGRLTPAQTAEYEALKKLRRRANPTRSFEEIRADIELHRAVNAAIAGLQQLIDHGTRVFRAEA